MDSRERLAMTLAGGEKRWGNMAAISKARSSCYAQADAILSSDWLRDTLAAERERCAKVAERVGQDFLSPEYAFPQPIGSIQERFACAQVAAAIRGDAK